MADRNIFLMPFMLQRLILSIGVRSLVLCTRVWLGICKPQSIRWDSAGSPECQMCMVRGETVCAREQYVVAAGPPGECS